LSDFWLALRQKLVRGSSFGLCVLYSRSSVAGNVSLCRDEFSSGFSLGVPRCNQVALAAVTVGHPDGRERCDAPQRTRTVSFVSSDLHASFSPFGGRAVPSFLRQTVSASVFAGELPLEPEAVEVYALMRKSFDLEILGLSRLVLVVDAHNS
jgi:hypothetical protein